MKINDTVMILNTEGAQFSLTSKYTKYGENFTEQVNDSLLGKTGIIIDEAPELSVYFIEIEGLPPLMVRSKNIEIVGE